MREKEVKPRVHFNFLKGGFDLKDRAKLKLFITNIFKHEGKQLITLNYIFCSDKYLLKINQDHLEHNYYTDIITFNLSEAKEIVGEVYISIDRVRDNALSLKTSFREELHRILFHGVLHLCGYQDKSKAETFLMRENENKWLRLYFKKNVPRGAKRV